MSLRVRPLATRVFAACLAFALSATAAHAQDIRIPARTLSPLFAQVSAPGVSTVAPASATNVATPTSRGALIPLYASFATLQMLDAHSTIRSIGAGGVEQNPLMRGLADKPAALVALKAGVAASTIVLADKMARRNRVGAIVLMAALNSAYAVVVTHNYRTLP
jgi:hypothetical protein